jgi:RHS repeat-associated protein
MANLSLRALFACALVLIWEGPSHAQDSAGGLSPTRLKLPTGPGSLEGVGENAEANWNMGLVTYGVPISVPSGYGGLAPSFNLSYSSSGGPSVVGMGWSMPTSFIARHTARGLPEYDTGDTFAMNGSDELVRLPGAGNVYRARFEGGFARYTWVDGSGQGRFGYWRVETPDGRVSWFGAQPNGTLETNARLEGSTGTYAYYLVATEDVFGHRVEYTYTKDGGRPYLTHARWVASDGGHRYEAELVYEARPDILRDGRPGVEVLWTQRLSAIRVRVRGQLLRRYQLVYEVGAQTGGLSRLSTVVTYGTDDTSAYPIAMQFEYARGFDPSCTGSGACARPFVRAVGSLGLDLATGRADFLDINSDGLPDIVDTNGSSHLFRIQNVSTSMMPTWASPVTTTVAGGGGMTLDGSGVHLVDLDGNGFADLVNGAQNRVLWNAGEGDWQSAEIVNIHLPDFVNDANLRFMDVDDDSRSDAIHVDAGNVWWFRNTGSGFETTARNVNPLGVGFEDNARLADMTGDGMVDLMQFAGSGLVTYYTHLGFGRFEGPHEMLGLPSALTPEEAEFVDLNGDALTDVVVVSGTEVRWSLNVNGESFGAMQTLSASQVDGGAIPERTGAVSMRYVDMNGNGSTDVVWVNASGMTTYLELFPVRPNLMKRIRNGIGKVIEMSYGSTVEQMALDGGPSAWSHRLPHPMQVLTELVTYDTLSQVRQIQTARYHDGYWDGEEHQFRGFARVELLATGDESIEDGRTISVFDVGAEDRYRHGRTLSQEIQSAGRSLSVTTNGFADCPLTGVPTSGLSQPVRWICPTNTEVEIREGRPAAEWVRTRTEWTYDGYGNRTAEHKFGVVTVGGGGCEVCTRPSSVQGAPCGDVCVGDEMHELIEYVPPTATGGRWILHAPYRKRTYGVDLALEWTEERTYYDGPDYAGAALGTLTRGVVKRVEALRENGTSDYVQVQRMRTDAHGNVVAVRDANGHERRIDYDADGVLPFAEEAVFEDAGHTPYRLRMEVAYEGALERVSVSTAWMRIEGSTNISQRRETRYGYDVWGRLSAIARPGDLLATPTQEFSYELADPASRIIARTRSVSGSAATDLEHVQCFDGLGRNYQERTRLRAGLYQVSGFISFNVQSKERRVHQPYQSPAAQCATLAPSNALANDIVFDATGRPLVVLEPDAIIHGTQSRFRNEYFPLRVESWDGEDSDATSLHANTPTSVLSDGLGRLVEQHRRVSQDASPIRTALTYDGVGRVRSLIDDAGNEQSQRYDALGRVTETEHPESGRTTYAYDAGNNLTERTDARGVTTRRAYDEANRIAATWDQASPSTTLVSFRYDDSCGSDFAMCANGEGQLVETSYPLLVGQIGRERISRDARGQQVGRYIDRGNRSYIFADGFDNAGRLSARTFPDGTTLSYSYDGAGRLVSVPGYVHEIAYDARGLAERTRFANGTETIQTYDARLRLASVRTTLPGVDDPAQALSYAWDRAGNLLSVGDSRLPSVGAPTENARYRYDALYRLTYADLDAGRPRGETLTYTYDRVDNTTGIVSSLGVRSAAHVGELHYGDGNAGPRAVTMVGEDAYVYDAAGQIVERMGFRHSWDHMGRLTSSRALDGNVRASENAYGADWTRVEHAERGHASEYIADDFEIRDGIATIYIKHGDRAVARIEHDAQTPDEMPDFTEDGRIGAGDAWALGARERGDEIGVPPLNSPSGPQVSVDVMLSVSAKSLLLGDEHRATTYTHTDHIGTVNAETDETGSITQRAQAYPYGTPRYALGSGWSRNGYAAMEREVASGLQQHGARWLDTRAGRWLSADAAVARLNLPDESFRYLRDVSSCYAYALNEPIASRDSSGMWATYIHIRSQNRVIENAGARYYFSRADIAQMTRVQYWLDGPENQSSTAQAFHAMTALGGNRAEYIAAANRLYDGHMRSAIAAERSGNSRLAMWHLGIALHISQDATSPSHEGAQVYRGSASPVATLGDGAMCVAIGNTSGCERVAHGVAHAVQELVEPEERSMRRDMLDDATRRTLEEFHAGVGGGTADTPYRAVDDQGLSTGQGD